MNQPQGLNTTTLASLELLAADVRALKVWRENFKVQGATFSNTSTGATLTIGAQQSGRQVAIGLDFLALKNGHEQDADNRRYFYGWKMAEMTDQGYGKCQAIEGGPQGTASDPDTRAINLAEEINAVDGVMGIGVEFPVNEDDTFDVKPIPDGNPIIVRRSVAKNGKVQFQIIASGYQNGIDGDCPPSDGSGDGGSP